MRRNIYQLFFLFLLVTLTAFGQQQAQLTDLPTLYIETYDGNPITSKTEYKYARMIYVDAVGTTSFDSLEIRGRGNSTWTLRKKPYRLKFAEKEKFLGTGYAKAKKWTLLANAADKTLMRNAITSLMGEWMGLKFNPAARFVDVVLNGKYEGNYQISDQVEVCSHRVDITEQDEVLRPGADLSGGYLLEVDGFADGNCFYSSRQSVPVRIHYPDENVITSAQNNYIKGVVNRFESALYTSNFQSEDSYRALVDSVSLVNWYIATEISANIDGFYSVYFYKEKGDDKLYFGPLWDYDIAYANDSRKGDTSKTLMVDNGYGQTKYWMRRMWEDLWFQQLVWNRWTEIRQQGIEDYLLQKIDSLALCLEQSQHKNYEKWGINVRMYNEYKLFSTYDQYVSFLKNFITTRCEFLDQAFAERKVLPEDPEEEPQPTPEFDLLENYCYRIINRGNSKALELENENGEQGIGVCVWDNLPDKQTEQWRIKKVGDSYYQLLNCKNGMALNDPTIGACTPTTNTGAQLNVVEPNVLADAQLWEFVPQGTEGCYNLVNKRTQHTANLSGGGSVNGTRVISYITDSKNATSNNRLWNLLPDEQIEEDNVDGLGAETKTEYALFYKATNQELHFVSDKPMELTFRATVYNIKGEKEDTFEACRIYNISHLPQGVYIVRWQFEGKTHAIKFIKQ